MRLALYFLAVLVSQNALAALTIYTDRPTDRVKMVGDVFTQETGVPVEVVELGYSALFKKLEAEGDRSSADVIFVKDMVYLSELAEKGYFQPVSSSIITNSVENSMRDAQGRWSAVSMRGRTIVYAPGRVSPEELSTYEDLADPKWAGALCLRTADSSYNDALVGSFIENLGYEKAKNLLRGWVNNLAQNVFPNDTSIIEAIANGVCDLGVVNTYYLAGILAKSPSFPVKVFFANQGRGGMHVNGSGIGVAKTSKQVELATKFIETIYRDDIQLALTGAHFEYPAKKGLLPSTLIREWGSFEADKQSWSNIGKRAAEARALAKEVGYP